jgi:hypothetical protein
VSQQKDEAVSNHIDRSKYTITLCGDGVRLSPLGTSATIWPTVPVPDDDDDDDDDDEFGIELVGEIEERRGNLPQ